MIGFFQLIVLLALGLFVLNLGYAFDGSFTKLSSYEFRSTALTGNDGNQSPELGNRFLASPLGNALVPLPKNYLLGIDHIKWEYEEEYQSFLRGEWKSGGWWYYYLYALCIKVPLGTLFLVGLCLVATILPNKYYVTKWGDEICLLAPMAIILFLVSSQTGFNHHMRYVLPALGFLFVWCGKLANVYQVNSNWKSRCVVGLLVGLALAWNSIATLRAHPNYIPFFNLTIEGNRGYEHLSNSNVDFGQGLIALNKYLDEKFAGETVHYDGWMPLVNPALAGIKYKHVEADQIPNEGELYVISANNLWQECYENIDVDAGEFVAKAIWVGRISHIEGKKNKENN
jgi:hypothetical protein